MPMYEWDGSGQVPVHFVCVVQITVLVSLQLECSNKRTALCTMYSNTPLAHTLLHPTFCHRTTHQGEHKALLHNCCLSLSLSLSLSGGVGGRLRGLSRTLNTEPTSQRQRRRRAERHGLKQDSNPRPLDPHSECRGR